MAHKRMFSKDITGSDAFRDMPSSTQALYFQLGMEADDDGFLGNFKSIQRAIGSSEDDMKLLVAKRFLLSLPGGIIVVKHWLVNNTIRKDRYTPTRYTEEKKLLVIKRNGSYSDDLSAGKPFSNHLATQKRIEEDRIDTSNDEEENANRLRIAKRISEDKEKLLKGKKL